MKKTLIVSAVMALALIACAPTPNNISLNVNQGQCVTGPYPGYESVVTQYSQAFPLNANLPGQSPYCVAVTVTNNNSGQNANNIQVNSSGLQLAYNIGLNSYNSSMIDYNAAGVSQSAFGGANQQLGNVALFDPNNCVTTQGSLVQTLGTNGGYCTFYVQLTNESMPVGVYPMTLTLNYTNGNANYSVSTTINQRVNLYVSTSQYPSITLTNANSTFPTANTVISANSSESFVPINALTRDAFGNVYTGDNVGNIYQYNGTTASSWNLVTGIPESGNPITSLASDDIGNIYAATQAGDLYQIESTSQGFIVNPLGTLPSSSIQLAVSINSTTTNVLYASTGNAVYQCTLTNPPTACFILSSTIPGGQTIQQLNAQVGAPSIAIESGIFQYNSTDWQIVAGGIPSPANAISLAFYLNPMLSSVATWYAGVNQGESMPALYSESDSVSFMPLLSSSADNYLSGIPYQIAVDLGQGVFVGGQALYSLDFASESETPSLIAYLPSPMLNQVESWTPITGVNGFVTGLQTATQLTTY